jgi:hypothetical protein
VDDRHLEQAAKAFDERFEAGTEKTDPKLTFSGNMTPEQNTVKTVKNCIQ